MAGERVSAHNCPLNIIYYMLEESCTVIGDRHVGLPPEKAGKIFEAFFTTSRRVAAWDSLIGAPSSSRMADSVTRSRPVYKSSPLNEMVRRLILPPLREDGGGSF